MTTGIRSGRNTCYGESGYSTTAQSAGYGLPVRARDWDKGALAGYPELCKPQPYTTRMKLIGRALK